jgi:hypothetical protein
MPSGSWFELSHLIATYAPSLRTRSVSLAAPLRASMSARVLVRDRRVVIVSMRKQPPRRK